MEENQVSLVAHVYMVIFACCCETSLLALYSSSVLEVNMIRQV